MAAELARNLIAEIAVEIYEASPEQFAEQIGRLYGMVLFELAVSAATAGYSQAAKSGRIASFLSKLDNIPGFQNPRVRNAVADVFRAIDHLQDGRRVSGQRFGTPPVDRGALNRFANEVKSLGGQLIENADDFLDAESKRVGKFVAAAFDPETGKLYIRKGASLMQVTHELVHLRQWQRSGRSAAAYDKLGRYSREAEVFREIWKNREHFTSDELRSAIEYMQELLRLKINGIIT